MTALQILVVDDEPDICALVEDILRDEGFEVSTARNAHQARVQFMKQRPDLVLLDIWMPGEDGISLLKDWQKAPSPTPPVIIMSGHGTVDTAIEATRFGAHEFVEKPLTTAKLLQSVYQALSDRIEPHVTLPPVREPVGQSKAVLALRKQAAQLAQSGANISIVGEPGTGKMALARYVHSLGNGRNAAFTLLHGVAMDEKTFFSALEKTSSGVLVIRHADRLPSQTRQAIVMSADRFESGRVRLIVTGADTPPEFSGCSELELEEIAVVALRNHIEDIPELVSACTDYWCQQRQLPYRRFSIAAQNRMLHYDWPANLSELNDFVCRLLEKGGDGDVSLEEVEELLEQQAARDDEKYIWAEQALNKPIREARAIFERAYLTHQLRLADGNVSRAAERIGMERSNLYRKLRSLYIPLHDGNKGS